MGMMRDIDTAWKAYGLDAYIGAPFNYWLVVVVCAMPFALFHRGGLCNCAARAVEAIFSVAFSFFLSSAF